MYSKEIILLKRKFLETKENKKKVKRERGGGVSFANFFEFRFERKLDLRRKTSDRIQYW